MMKLVLAAMAALALGCGSTAALAQTCGRVAPADPSAANQPLTRRDVGFIKRPALLDMLRFYPAGALSKPAATVQVWLNCKISPIGDLVDCSLRDDGQPGSGFAEAALSLSKVYRLQPRACAGQPIAGRDIHMLITFDQGLHAIVREIETAQAAVGEGKPVMISAPDWAMKPGAAEIGRFYPAAARRQEKSGWAYLLCAVAITGALERCQVDAESDYTLGFGDAAMKMAPNLRFRPVTVNGKPVGGARVLVPVFFRLE